MDSSILREFLAETEDLLEVLFGDLQALRARRNEGRARRELVGRIFRHVHTLKGSSATIEFETITKLAHEFESLLDGVRLGAIPLGDEVLDAFDAGANAISQSLGAISRAEALPDTQPIIERLQKLAQPGSDKQSASLSQKSVSYLPEELARALSKHEAHRLKEAIEEGSHLFVVNVNFDLATFDKRFRNLSDALAEDGEIISTLPGLATESPDKISFRIVCATKETREELMARINAFGEVSLTELPAAREQEAGKEKRAATGGDAASTGAPFSSIAPLTTNVRVELAELEKLIAGAHELLIETTATLDLMRGFELQPAERVAVEERQERARERLVELEEKLIGLRMVPVAQMLERAARSGRLAARATGKEVEFEIVGGHVRLDKALADTIADPLLHILRNAVDHGIEQTQERARIGKRPRGLVRLEARAEGNRVLLRVVDDGRGVDPLRITRAAAAQGIIEAGRLLTKEQALRLIFRPGFSTAASISNVSGRGVGLDVVERAVEQTGGELRVTSDSGKGTRFEIMLPTTLALLQALIINSAGYRYCLDASRVIETGFISPADVERNINVGAIDWRGSKVPFIEMRKLLSQLPVDVKSIETNIPVLIVSRNAGRGGAGENGAKHAAIMVDAVEGQTETLVRGLGRYSPRWRGIGGATELRDGTLALVLDLPRLLETI
jgi:two-component system chemotaxis sensor kinase CheA